MIGYHYQARDRSLNGIYKGLNRLISARLPTNFLHSQKRI